MKKTMVGAAAALALAGTTLGAPSASALLPTRGNGEVVATCPGKVVASGRLRSAAGASHPTATWRLYASKTKAGTACLRIYDGAPGRHAMSGSLTDTSGSGAYESSGYETATPGFLIHHVKKASLTISGSISDDSGTYDVHKAGIRIR